MYYVLTIFIGIFLGILAEAWAAKLPQPPSLHERCEDRFNRMCRQMGQEIRVREEEIQRLVRGQT